MDLQLTGSVVVVIGAARGLGHAIAAAFAAEGARVALMDVSPEVEAAARQLGAAAFVADVTDYAAISDAAVELRDVTFAYDTRTILKGITMIVPRGKVVAIMGASGGGKTTILRLIGGQLKPRSGQVLVAKDLMEF